MQVHYLEIVTPDVEAVCAAYSQVHGLEFGESDPSLGGARTAKLSDGGMMGVRAPMHDGESPTVRPYSLVEDIQKAVSIAADSGAQVAVPPMELPGHGQCAILIQGDIQVGLWQKP